MGCGYPDELSHLKRAPTCFVTVSLGAASRKPQVEPVPTGGRGALGDMDESASNDDHQSSLILKLRYPGTYLLFVFLESQFKTDVNKPSLNALLAIHCHRTMGILSLHCPRIPPSSRARCVSCHPALDSLLPSPWLLAYDVSRVLHQGTVAQTPCHEPDAQLSVSLWILQDSRHWLACALPFY